MATNPKTMNTFILLSINQMFSVTTNENGEES